MGLGVKLSPYTAITHFQLIFACHCTIAIGNTVLKNPIVFIHLLTEKQASIYFKNEGTQSRMAHHPRQPKGLKHRRYPGLEYTIAIGNTNLRTPMVLIYLLIEKRASIAKEHN
jgi:hypothetical protein